MKKRKELTVEDCIESFSRVETISEIIILGVAGGIRRIQVADEDEEDDGYVEDEDNPDPDIEDGEDYDN